MKQLSAEDIQTAIARLSDPKVNYRLDLASTPHVARRIIQSLPGVKKLSEGGPETEAAFLELLQNENTLQDENLSAISVYILWSYPSERVKVALAKPISERKFRGMSAQLASETFLKAAGIEALPEDAITVALREAKRFLHEDSANQYADQRER